MTSFLITCCNATCAIPEAQRELFKGSEDLVTSTDGWEPGSLNLAQGLAMKFSTPLIHGDVSKMLINLEEADDKLWSDISITLPEGTRGKLIERHQEKFRHAIETRLVEDFKRHETVVHLDIHTAPIADGQILFEYTGATISEELASKIVKLLPDHEVDSKVVALTEKNPFITWMMNQENAEKIGIIRITVSQSFFMKSIPLRWETIKKAIIKAIDDSTSEIKENRVFGRVS